MKKVIKDIYSKWIFNVLKNCMNFIMICQFCQNDWKLKKSKNLFNNLHDKTEYVIHMKNLNQVSNHKIILKKVHRVIKFNQNSWLKLYIDMSNNLTQNLLAIEIRKNQI